MLFSGGDDINNMLNHEVSIVSKNISLFLNQL